MLAVCVVGDTMTPPHALDRMLDFTPQAAVTRDVYRHDQAQAELTHLNWPRHGDAVAERIVDWFRTTLHGDAPFTSSPPRQTP
jgi:predicted alpha/beta hydrolase